LVGHDYGEEVHEIKISRQNHQNLHENLIKASHVFQGFVREKEKHRCENLEIEIFL
jgi:hypothetical protein